MYKTRDKTECDVVRVLDSAKANEITLVFLYYESLPIPFEVIVHRDVVVGELLELDR